MRLFIFESHPVQYHAPVYRELHELCARAGGASVRVVYATDISLRGYQDPGFGQRVAWDEPLLAGYPCEVLGNERGEPLRGFRSLSGRGVFQLLRRERPDAVMLTNLAYAFDWAAYLGAKLLRIPVWLRTETQDQAFARSCAKSVFRTVAYRCIYAGLDRALVIGRLNAQHFHRHGIGPGKRFFSPYCVVDRFEALGENERGAMRASVRALGPWSQEQTLLLFCGKLEPKKNPGVILEALERLPANERRRFGVLFVGSGELEDDLRNRAISLPELTIRFTGFKNQRELPAYYLGADALVLPSRQMGETWGLVVNEALLAERQVVVSRHVGSSADFRELRGVRVFDGSAPALARAFLELTPAPALSGQRHFMRRYSVRAAAEGIALAMGIQPAPATCASNARRRFQAGAVVASQPAGICSSSLRVGGSFSP